MPIKLLALTAFALFLLPFSAIADDNMQAKNCSPTLGGPKGAVEVTFTCFENDEERQQALSGTLADALDRFTHYQSEIFPTTARRMVETPDSPEAWSAFESALLNVQELLLAVDIALERYDADLTIRNPDLFGAVFTVGGERRDGIKFVSLLDGHSENFGALLDRHAGIIARLIAHIEETKTVVDSGLGLGEYLRSEAQAE
jgi:hypothetical protein